MRQEENHFAKGPAQRSSMLRPETLDSGQMSVMFNWIPNLMAFRSQRSKFQLYASQLSAIREANDPQTCLDLHKLQQNQELHETTAEFKIIGSISSNFCDLAHSPFQG